MTETKLPASKKVLPAMRDWVRAQRRKDHRAAEKKRPMRERTREAEKAGRVIEAAIYFDKYGQMITAFVTADSNTRGVGRNLKRLARYLTEAEDDGEYKH